MNNWKSPIHPGEILADELEEINLNVSQLATRVNLSENELEQILKGQGNITGDIALKLGRFFNTGKFDAHKVVALTGSEAIHPKYYKTIIGANLADLDQPFCFKY